MAEINKALPPHAENLLSNIKEVARLVGIHQQLTGTGPGRRHDVEVLNKSAIILLVACWESYIEVLAATSFDYMADHATSPDIFPKSVLTLASRDLRGDADESKVWELAGDGWKTTLSRHREVVFDRFIGKLNTPKPAFVNELFERLIGLKRLSSAWQWRGTTTAQATGRLERLVELRGEIAHRVSITRAVRLQTVVNAVNLTGRLATTTSNRVANFLGDQIGEHPWNHLRYTDPW
jgi:hypothetical protein